MIKQKDIDEFEKTSEKLAIIIKRISEYHPGANLYLANDTLSLMKGPSHDDSNQCRPIHENVVWSVLIPGMDGGDW